MSSPNIESDGQAQELQSISSTNFLYNRQADSITSIPHLTQNDLKHKTKWKEMALNVVVSLVVSLLVVLIFEYSKYHQEISPKPSNISTEIKQLYEKLNLVETKQMNLEKNLTKVVNIMDQHSQMEENTYKNSLISLENDIDTLKRNHAKDYTNCKDYFDEGINKSGQYYILKNGAVIQVSCFFEGMDYETCHDYFNVGFNSSGLYYVYVDGISYQIYCNFESGEGITQFFHDHPDKQEIPNCDGKDCYNLTLVYDNTPQQIASIVERSRSCKQKFEFDCNLSPLSDFGAWINNRGQRQSYFSGSSGVNVCDCGTKVPNQCQNLPGLTSNKCNCDAREPVDRRDVGFITNHVDLPMTGFLYSYKKHDVQKALVSIGPLECEGKLQNTTNLEWFNGESTGIGNIGFHNVKMNFEDAKKYCASLNSHLIEFSTQAQYDFLKQKVTTIHEKVWTDLNSGPVWWLGLEYRSDGNWYWIHSNTLCKFGNCWDHDGKDAYGVEPEHGMVLYMFSKSTMSVDDEDKSNLFFPICQIKN